MKTRNTTPEPPPGVDQGRRAFFGALGAAVGAAALSAGCSSSGSTPERPAPFPDQDTMEVRWGFLVDLRKCHGCKSCVISCKTENDVRLGVFRTDVRTFEKGSYPDTKRLPVPWLCNHCQNPPCILRCPVDMVDAALTFPSGKEVSYRKAATYQRPDGLVLIDQDRCVGCGRCVEDCPYGVRYLDPVKKAGGNESFTAADKCTLCVHRLEQGLVPSCVNTCPSGARVAGNLNDPNSEISKALAENEADISVLLPEAGTEPRCFYIGLDPEAYSKGSDTKLLAQLKKPELHRERY